MAILGPVFRPISEASRGPKSRIMPLSSPRHPSGKMGPKMALPATPSGGPWGPRLGPSQALDTGMMPGGLPPRPPAGGPKIGPQNGLFGAFLGPFWPIPAPKTTHHAAIRAPRPFRRPFGPGSPKRAKIAKIATFGLRGLFGTLPGPLGRQRGWTSCGTYVHINVHTKNGQNGPKTTPKRAIFGPLFEAPPASHPKPTTM